MALNNPEAIHEVVMVPVDEPEPDSKKTGPPEDEGKSKPSHVQETPPFPAKDAPPADAPATAAVPHGNAPSSSTDDDDVDEITMMFQKISLSDPQTAKNNTLAATPAPKPKTLPTPPKPNMNHGTAPATADDIDTLISMFQNMTLKP